jgi:hypothetical protein
MRALAQLLVGLLGTLSLVAQQPAADPAGAAREPSAPTARAATEDGATADAQRPAQDDEGAAGARSPRQQRLASSLWDARLRALDDRYPWLAPTESFQWVSLGITLFALLSLAIHIAARLAASELLGFGRATLAAAWIMLAGLVQVAAVSDAGHALALAVVANAVMLLLCFRFLYRLPVPAAGLAVFLFVVQVGLGFALLRLVDATLRSIGNTTF